MDFTPKELEEFRVLCHRLLGFKPTLEEAQIEGSKLVYLVSLIQGSRKLTDEELNENNESNII